MACCDRCGAAILENGCTLFVVSGNVPHQGRTITANLCTDCAALLADFMRGADVAPVLSCRRETVGATR